MPQQIFSHTALRKANLRKFFARAAREGKFWDQIFENLWLGQSLIQAKAAPLLRQQHIRANRCLY